MIAYVIQLIHTGYEPFTLLNTHTLTHPCSQVAAVFEYATSNAVEPFLEPVLELCHAIIARDMGEVASGSSTGALMAVLLDQAPLFLDCASHPDSAVSLAAAGCLADLVGGQGAKGQRGGGRGRVV